MPGFSATTSPLMLVERLTAIRYNIFIGVEQGYCTLPVTPGPELGIGLPTASHAVALPTTGGYKNSGSEPLTHGTILIILATSGESQNRTYIGP